MRQSLTALAALLLVAGCATSLTDSSGQDVPTTGDPFAGAELYADNCASCHGADLRGTDMGPPFLDAVYEPGHHADGAFQLAVARGVQPHHWDFGAMPPIPGLSEQDVLDITAYVRQEQQVAGIE